ncbi:DUF5677 domain-containing protein [Nocardiopsis sp. NPDC058631]|uniref:DUF5677 domain-containing protein n=1 Tax=Nocardiopsis sp. NPDC058631 TaxID=3346566 RepID=UPI003649CBC5
MLEAHGSASDEKPSNDTTEAEAGLLAEVDEVLHGERTLWRATERLVGLTAPYVDEVCLGVPLTEGGFNVDIVSRTIVRRAHDALAAITAAVDSPARANARVHLRTMTEDLIFLQWLRSLDEGVAAKFVQINALVEALTAVDTQEKFLPIAYQRLGTDVPNLGFPDVTDTLERAKNDLKELCRGQGWWRNRPPTIRKMAEETDLVQVYDFFYSLSSKAVHSNLHEMGRMVWGTEHTVDISSKPFEDLHPNLAVVYGTWLFHDLLSAVMGLFEPIQRLSSGQAYGVWLALILFRPAHNGRLPLLIHPEELRWRRGSA